MTDGERDAPVVASMKSVVEFPDSSDPSAGDGAQILVPGRKRLMRELRDSDSDSDDEADSTPLTGKRLCVYVSPRTSTSPKLETKGRGFGSKWLDSEDSDDSEGDVHYARTERAELSQSLLTSWLVPRSSRKGAGV